MLGTHKTAMINLLPPWTRKLNERHNLKPRIESAPPAAGDMPLTLYERIESMSGQQLTVSFISSESGEAEPDIIVAFAFVCQADPSGVDNLILIRTPIYEGILPPEEQGVSVSFDGNNSDEKGFLRQFKLDGDKAHVYTDEHHYYLELDGVEPDELELMRETIKKMNFDERFETKGV